MVVDEEGTEAAAATAVVAVRSLPPRIRFNRPFLFLIEHVASGTPMFTGVVLDP